MSRPVPTGRFSVGIGHQREIAIQDLASKREDSPATAPLTAQEVRLPTCGGGSGKGHILCAHRQSMCPSIPPNFPQWYTAGSMRDIECADLVIPTPNLRIMLHHYHSDEHLFQTVTMVTGARREQAIEEIARANAWFGGRFFVDNRSEYMKRRLFIEAQMYKEFSEKHAAPPSANPVFLTIRPHLSIDSAAAQRARGTRREVNKVPAC